MFKKENLLIFTVGLFILSYVLDASVDPLVIDLATPYQYLNPEILTHYPFTTTSIFIKALGLFITPLLLLSFLGDQHFAKGSILIVISGLTQLYALQELITNAQIIPLEWTISITVAGLLLLIPVVIYYIRGFMSSFHEKIAGEYEDDEE